MRAGVAGRVEVVEDQLCGAIVGGSVVRTAELLQARLLGARAGSVARGGGRAGEEAWEEGGGLWFGFALERDSETVLIRTPVGKDAGCILFRETTVQRIVR